MCSSKICEVPARLIKIMYTTICVEKVASPITTFTIVTKTMFVTVWKCLTPKRLTISKRKRTFVYNIKLSTNLLCELCQEYAEMMLRVYSIDNG